jgi:ribonucleoside-diphosphate reductase alpha chain
MQIDKNALTVLEARYLAKGEDGKPAETVEGLFRRVAAAIAAPDAAWGTPEDVKASAEEFYELMANMEFLPNSPTLMNAGRPLGQLSACFVLPVEDTMEGIFDAVKNAALIHKSGGGTGFSFSRIRPKGSAVKSTNGVASGPISFMKVFNMATEAVKQGGTRRGANMGILRVDHPDILEFIDCKQDTKEITNFNISVGITEAFMQAVENGSDYDLVDPHTKQPVGRLRAGAVFDRIVDAAWRNGEPGIVFLDRLNRDNAVPSMGEIESTNPCGEQPLLPYESCNLGSINLTKMVSGGEIDWLKLEATIKSAVHFLDNVIEANKYPLGIIAETTKSARKVGLGVMGWADLLLMLGIPYNSEQAVELAGRLMAFLDDAAKRASEALAATRGTFPAYQGSAWDKKRRSLRNATVTTIAPTGTLSIIAGVSSGVEPVFGYVYIRNVMDGTEMLEVNPVLKSELERRALYSEALMKRIAAGGHIADIDELPEDIRRVFVSAHDVSPEWHIRMQAAFQAHTDNAVSKTVNFPNGATRDEVAEAYLLAYRLGCKGVTIYRDGSRTFQVLNIGKVNKGDGSPEGAEGIKSPEGRVRPRVRPDVTNGLTERMKIGCGNLYVTVNFDSLGICEVFTNTGKAGGCPSQIEATARLVSIALRSGIDASRVVDELKGIRCPSTIRLTGMKCTSCPDAIARVIEKVVALQGGEPAAAPQAKSMETHGPAAQQKPAPAEAPYEPVAGRIRFCPECGAPVEHEGGCIACRQCGFSRCG